MSLISLAVLRDERDHPTARATATATATAAETVSESIFGASPDPVEPPAPQVAALRRGRTPLRLLSAAAAVLLLVAGIAIGRALAPAQDSVDFGPALALTPPADAVDQAPRGSVAVGTEGASLAVRLSATSLPTSGWYECVWVATGQSRSAGSFRAANGVVKDIRLRVAPPQDSQTWDLQLVHHQGTASEVVLEGAAEYHP